MIFIYFLKYISLTTIHLKSKINIVFHILLYYVYSNQTRYKDNHLILYITIKHNFISIFFFFNLVTTNLHLC
jgi:hypothetical protein